MKHSKRVPVSPGTRVLWASNGVGLAMMSNEAARLLARRPEDEWEVLCPNDGSGDEIRLIEHDGCGVVCYLRGEDGRGLLGSPVSQVARAGRDAVLVACREISSEADKREAVAKAEGWWDTIDPRRVPGEA